VLAWTEKNNDPVVILHGKFTVGCQMTFDNDVTVRLFHNFVSNVTQTQKRGVPMDKGLERHRDETNIPRDPRVS
jgi:hypothetical protein